MSEVRRLRHGVEYPQSTGTGANEPLRRTCLVVPDGLPLQEAVQLLSEDHRFIFTLIQKFGTKKGQKYPKLSDRSDIIVMTDEAHRSQYDTLALNMRNALPNAAFIGFTGTPLMAGEEKTKDVFGDYVSVYNFQQSIEDGATVPLFYENRIPELQLANENFNEDLEALIEAAELDEEQEKKLEREFAREYHLITRDDRLEKVAEDLVSHFMGRKDRRQGDGHLHRQGDRRQDVRQGSKILDGLSRRIEVGCGDLSPNAGGS